jgi:hypothetical protein
MTHQTSKRQKRSASKAASRTIGTGTRDRPVTMSINGDCSRLRRMTQHWADYLDGLTEGVAARGR